MTKLAVGLIKILLILVLVSAVLTWISDNLWILALPLLLFVVYVANKTAGGKYGSKSRRRYSSSKPGLPRRPSYIPQYNSEQNKRRLFRTQRGQCGACGHPTVYSLMEVDHIHPRSRWPTYEGTHVDEPYNLQLLCRSCNRSKGNKTMDEFRRYRRRKWL